MARFFVLLLLFVLTSSLPALFGLDVSSVRGEMTAVATSAAVQNSNYPPLSAIRGTVTWLDKNRGLVVLQDGSKATAIRVDLPQMDFVPGDRVVLEGQISPMVAAFPAFPNNPTSQEICPIFESPTNQGENYLTRMRGFLHPPATGEYTFWIASDDSSELFLSRDDSPSNVRKIAAVENGRWTESRQWNRFPSQKSQGILLKAGETYYIEAISQQGWGKDCLSVAWQGAGLSQSVIDGRYLTPWIRADENLINSAAHATSNGILREYWENFFSSDLNVLKMAKNSKWNLSGARLVEKNKVELPDSVPVEIGQILKPEQNFCRVEMEGRLVFFANQNGCTELELKAGQARIRIHVAGNMAPPPENSLLRVRGVCEAVRDSNNELVAGHVWVNDPQNITWSDMEENWTQLKPIQMHLLTPFNPDLSAGRLIQVRGKIIRQESSGVWSIQGDDVFEGYTSADGTNWNSIGAPMEFAMNDSALVGVAVASHQSNSLAEVQLNHVSGLLKNLQGADIGSPSIAGGMDFNQGALTVRGSGNDIWGISDQCYFAYQPMTGDREVVVHVASLKSADLQAKVGIMIRESLDSQSPWAAMVATPSDRVGLQSRREFGKNSAGTLSNQKAQWLKLTRHRQSLLIQPRDAEKIRPGQVLDVIGRLSWKNEKPVLAGAYVREAADAPNVKLGNAWTPFIRPLVMRQFPVVSVCCFAATQGSGGRRA